MSNSRNKSGKSYNNNTSQDHFQRPTPIPVSARTSGVPLVSPTPYPTVSPVPFPSLGSPAPDPYAGHVWHQSLTNGGTREHHTMSDQQSGSELKFEEEFNFGDELALDGQLECAEALHRQRRQVEQKGAGSNNIKNSNNSNSWPERGAGREAWPGDSRGRGGVTHAVAPSSFGISSSSRFTPNSTSHAWMDTHEVPSEHREHRIASSAAPTHAVIPSPPVAPPSHSHTRIKHEHTPVSTRSTYTPSHPPPPRQAWLPHSNPPDSSDPAGKGQENYPTGHQGPVSFTQRHTYTHAWHTPIHTHLHTHLHTQIYKNTQTGDGAEDQRAAAFRHREEATPRTRQTQGFSTVCILLVLSPI
jgi:hypothetical protein